MSRLRAAAAACVEAGRWLATVEILRDELRRLDEASPEERAPCAVHIIERAREMLPEYERAVESTRAHAEALMNELEHPGAVLARRLITTARAARAAWRGSR